MRYSQRVEMDDQEKERWKAHLSGDVESDVDVSDTILQRTVLFEDGTFADVNLAEAKPNPYINVVLFDEGGHTIDYAEPIGSLGSEVMFEVQEDIYRVIM